MKKYLFPRVAGAFAFSMSVLVCFVATVHAQGPAARASSEPSIGGIAPEEYWDRQLELHGWLMSELPDGALDKPIRVPLTGKDRKAIANDSTPPPRPLRVGMVKRVGKTVKLWRGGPVAKTPARLAHGVIRGKDDGGFVWAVALDSDGASALRVNISGISLPDTADIYFFTLDGQAHGPYRGEDEFWSNTVMGAHGILLVRQFGPPATGTRPMSVSISSVGNMGERFVTAAKSTLCSYNASCTEDAIKSNGQLFPQPAPDLMAATAYMEWVHGAWIYSCSGGLLADKDDSSQIPYFLTANHCLKSNAAAKNLELYWDYTTLTDTCSGPIGPATRGGTVKVTGPQGDFTLLELKETPPAGRMYMGWNSAEIANKPDVALHRISHPSGAPQSYTTHVTDPDFGTCSGLPIPQFIYSNDTFGSTEGGSSGSLVANDAGEVVGQLYGGCGSNFDVCDPPLPWRTVDGAFSYYYDRVAPFLAASCEPVAEICLDGIDNDCDTEVDCDDGDCSKYQGCQTPCAPRNGACSVNDDCCSGTCKRNGRCR